MKCPRCGVIEVVERRHPATGEKIYYLKEARDIIHKCSGPPRPTKYWCMKCNAPIPLSNPCIHKRQEKGEIPKGLDVFTE